MIMICERCCAPIEDGESLVRLAHIDRAHGDGSVTWVHAYAHLEACAEPRPAQPGRPDTSDRDAPRGLGGHRA